MLNNHANYIFSPVIVLNSYSAIKEAFQTERYLMAGRPEVWRAGEQTDALKEGRWHFLPGDKQQHAWFVELQWKVDTLRIREEDAAY